MNTTILRKKLRYRSNNMGCRELDIILGQFAAKYLDSMQESDLLQYQLILELEDAILYDYLVNKVEINRSYLNPVMKQLLSFHIALL